GVRAVGSALRSKPLHEGAVRVSEAERAGDERGSTWTSHAAWPGGGPDHDRVRQRRHENGDLSRSRRRDHHHQRIRKPHQLPASAIPFFNDLEPDGDDITQRPGHTEHDHLRGGPGLYRRDAGPAARRLEHTDLTTNRWLEPSAVEWLWGRSG